MRFQWSLSIPWDHSSIPWDHSYSWYVKSKLYSTYRRSHALNCQVTPSKQSEYRCVRESLWGTQNTAVIWARCTKPVHPMRHLNESSSRKDRYFDPGRMDFSSCCCWSHCLSVSYSPHVESLRWDRPVHKEGWTRSWTHDNPTGWPISGHLCVATSFSNCQRTATRPQKGHWSHGIWPYSK